MSLPSRIQTVVIGAGAAGLSAAKALRLAGHDAIVLEAAGHIGGRCVTDKTSFSSPFDLGGSWLHSASINPLARLVEETKTPLHKAPWIRKWMHILGMVQTPAQVRAFSDVEDQSWKAIVAAGAQQVDCDAKSALPPSAWPATIPQTIAQMMAGDADLISARDVHNYADATGDWLVEGGLGAIVAQLHADVPVRLNCLVSAIDYSGRGVRVTTPDGTLRADRAVVTVSTSVLASGAIEFTPSLPQRKTNAIHALPCGLLNKVGIEFAPSWQEATQGQMADYQSGEDEFCSLLFGFYDGPLATGFVAGRFADALEKEREGAATSYCLEGLRAIFGSDVSKHVLRTKETGWRKNPLTLGSYSYAKPGAASARQTLAEPLDTRIYFAGEATMTDTYSTVHGAYLSGQRAAGEIIAAHRPMKSA